MRLKRLTSLILSIAMVMGFVIIPQTASAADREHLGEVSNQRADISFEYLGQTTGTNKTTGFPALYTTLREKEAVAQDVSVDDLDPDRFNPPAGDMKEIQAGNYIWIGVRVKNMSRIASELGAGNNGTPNGGVGAMNFSMTYNENYFEPVFSAANVLNANGLIQKAYPRVNIAEDGDDPDLVRDFYTGKFTGGGALTLSDKCEPYVLDGLAAKASGSVSGFKQITEEIEIFETYKSADYQNKPRLFQNRAEVKDTDGATVMPAYTLDDEGMIVGLFAFQVKQVPEGGARVLQAALGGDRFNINCSFNASNPKLLWGPDINTEGSNNLKALFNLVDAEGNPSNGLINVFPSQYEVRYYNSQSDAQAAATAGSTDASEVLKVNTITPDPSDPSSTPRPIADDDTLELPDENLFTVEDGKVIKSFKYLDPAGTADGAFEATTTMMSCKYDANHIIYVYPELEDGVPVNFHGNNAEAAGGTEEVKTVYLKKTATYIPESKIPTGFTIPTGKSIKGWYTGDDEATSTAVVFDKDGATGQTALTSLTGDATNGYNVYAIYMDTVTIEYYMNVAETETTTYDKKENQLPNDPYVDPTPAPTNGDYTFLGWNTKSNGAGTMISASDTDYDTYTKVYTKYFADNTELDSDTDPTVKLYAQWGMVDDPTVDPYVPDENGVEVTFDSNVADGVTVTAANPQNKYPKLGEAIGTWNMPDIPVRTDYQFNGWNTKPDGTGAAVTGNTLINTTIGGKEGATLIEGATNKYELTLYAQWEATGATKVSVKFFKNEDGAKGTADAEKCLEYQVMPGDPLGFVPEDIANATKAHYDFLNWIDASGAEFDPDEPITAVSNYFAYWQVNLVAGIYDDTATSDPKILSTVAYDYTGEVIDPNYMVYEVDPNEETGGYTIISTVKDNQKLGSDADYEVKYSTIDLSDGSVIDADQPLKNVANYKIEVERKATSTAYPGFAVGVTVPTAAVTINKVNLAPVVKTDNQYFKVGDTLEEPITSVKGLKGDDVAAAAANPSTFYEIEYYKYVDTNSDGKVDADELTKVNWSAITNTDPGKYVVKLVSKSDNYGIDAAEKSDDSTGTAVDVYDPATNPGVAVGQNIVFDINYSKPWITGAVIQSVDSKDNDGNAYPVATKTPVNPYTDDTFTTPATIGSVAQPTDAPAGATPAPNYVRVGNEGDEVEIVLSMSDDTINPNQVKGKLNGTDLASDAISKVGNDIVIKLPLTAFAPELDKLTITTTDADGNDAYEYDLFIQRVNELPTVDFAPGNSPFGMIERMGAKWGGTWTDEGENDYSDPSNPVINNKVEHAKDLFIHSDDADNGGTGLGHLKFKDADHTPTFASALANDYTTAAWRSYDPDFDPDNPFELNVNYDLDPDALFVYTKYTFEDPGLKLYDQAGNEVANPTIKKKDFFVKNVNVSSGTPMYDDALDEVGAPVNIQETTKDGKTFYSFGINHVRADVYSIDYEIEYQDISDPANPVTKTITVSRPVIVLQERGDLTFTDVPQVNTGDVAVMRSDWGSIENKNSIYAFRIADVAYTDVPQINTGDVSDIRNYWGAGFTSFYDVQNLLNGALPEAE